MLGDEGVRCLCYFLMLGYLKNLKQLVLMSLRAVISQRVDNRISEGVAQSLIQINCHESNPTNIVIPETQLVQLSHRELDCVNSLYDQIDQGTVKTLEIGFELSDICLQLYFAIVTTTLVNRVEKIVIKNTPMNNYRLHLFLAYMRQYACYDRCNVLKCIALNGGWWAWRVT